MYTEIAKSIDLKGSHKKEMVMKWGDGDINPTVVSTLRNATKHLFLILNL